MQLKESQNLLTSIVVSLPLMALNTLLTIAVFSLFRPMVLSDLGISQEGFQITIDLQIIAGLIAGLIALLLVHELLHLILVPHFTSSEKTYVGMTPMVGYVYSEEEIPKWRYLLITIMPFVVISLIVPLILGILSLLSPLVLILIIINSIASSVDVLTFITIVTQVPNGSYLTSNGLRTYWKT